MICPHCKKEIVVKTTVHRAPSKRHAYWQKRHIESGKAKIRTSVDQLGKCVGCGAEVEGKKEYCKRCERIRKNERDKQFYQRVKAKEQAA